jgi:hypothetical protein
VKDMSGIEVKINHKTIQARLNGMHNFSHKLVVGVKIPNLQWKFSSFLSLTV